MNNKRFRIDGRLESVSERADLHSTVAGKVSKQRGQKLATIGWALLIMTYVRIRLNDILSSQTLAGYEKQVDGRPESVSRSWVSYWVNDLHNTVARLEWLGDRKICHPQHDRKTCHPQHEDCWTKCNPRSRAQAQLQAPTPAPAPTPRTLLQL